MKMLWCRRREAEMPMLDEAEYAQMTASGEGTALRERRYAVLEKYEKTTGYHETNPNAVYHHRFCIYGKLCRSCGRPLARLRQNSAEAA